MQWSELSTDPAVRVLAELERVAHAVREYLRTIGANEVPNETLDIRLEIDLIASQAQPTWRGATYPPEVELAYRIAQRLEGEAAAVLRCWKLVSSPNREASELARNTINDLADAYGVPTGVRYAVATKVSGS